MLSKVKRLHSPDLPGFPEELPENPSDFAMLLQVIVGPANEPGEESFDVMIYTSAWLEREVLQQGGCWLDRCLIVDRIDPNQIAVLVNKRFSGVAGQSWNEIAVKLSKLGEWEFDDYQES